MSAIFDIELQDAGLPHRDESEDDDIIEIDAVIKASPPSFISRREWESRYLRPRQWHVYRVNRHSNAASVFLFAGGMRHAERA